MPLRSFKVTAKEGAHYDGKLHPENAVVAMPDDVANRFARAGKGEILPASVTGPVVMSDNPYRAAVDPLVPDADPAHAARLGSARIDDHPGLLELNDANHPSVPKRAGRLDPETTVVEVAPSPPVVTSDTKLAKPPKG